MISPMIGMPQGAEWLVILIVVVLIFGAAKLPELSRAFGQSLRIFKAETKGLIDDDKSEDRTAAPRTATDTPTDQREIEARRVDSERVAPERARRDDTTA